jgi:hypothetical protein
VEALHIGYVFRGHGDFSFHVGVGVFGALTYGTGLFELLNYVSGVKTTRGFLYLIHKVGITNIVITNVKTKFV